MLSSRSTFIVLSIYTTQVGGGKKSRAMEESEACSSAQVIRLIPFLALLQHCNSN